jgi:hypothetical protein
LSCHQAATRAATRARLRRRPDRELDAAAVIAGADGTVSRDGDPDRLVRTIKRIVCGDPVVQTALGADCIRALIDRVEDRDRAITAMLLQRVPPDEIAWTLGISASSFRARRREIVRRIEQTAGIRPVELVGTPQRRAEHPNERRAASEVPIGAVQTRRVTQPIIQQGGAPRSRFSVLRPER